MYPTLFTIPGLGLEISSFGVMLAIAFLVGSWIANLQIQEKGLDADASTLLIYVMLGGIVGSKLYFAIDIWFREGRPFMELLLSRGGITWYGGLVGAIVVGAIGCRIHGVSIKAFADCDAVSAAVGQSLGRVGCFLVGDDWGRPTDLPWGIAFPRGVEPTDVPVHPTMLYEALWLMPVAGFLWWRRKKSPFLFGEYLACNGLGRFFIETWRTNERVLFGLTEAQIIGVSLILLGVGGWIYYARKAAAESHQGSSGL
ncbi:MAG: prolipoprotein diacylglyceryl transferase [Myxococcales bacterium]|nr:prolipoprotein diacylglyceryl transferase [Myxococcales bacterium]